MSLLIGNVLPQKPQQTLVLPEKTAPLPLSKFELKDIKKWEGYIKDNGDDLGRRVLRFASNWAFRMERAMKQGQVLPNIVNRTRMDTFMYNRVKLEEQRYATAILGKVWAHGEELMKVVRK